MFAADHVVEADTPSMMEARIEDGKLYFDKKWYHRGQCIGFRLKDGSEGIGNIININNTEVRLR